MSEDNKENKVYKKRPHRKVKSGCTVCKRRKIKCDEEKPQCSNCARYSAECIYPSSSCDVIRDPASAGSSSTTPPFLTPESGTYDETPVPQFPTSQDLPMREMGLMHHWSTATCYGFGDQFPDEVAPWRDNIPIIAQEFPFLMRGLLAVTALHMARLTSDHNTRYQYVQLAAYHQDLALPEYRAALIDVTEKSVTACIAFAALITVYSFAAPKDNSMSVYTSGAPEWMYLHRGVGDIPPHWQNWLEKGPLHGQLHRRRLSIIDPAVNPDDHKLLQLREMLNILPGEEHNDIQTYESTIYWLRQAFAHTFCAESRLGPKYAILFWAERSPQGFLELLAQRRQMATVLLAHCCILLKRASNFWYFEGFAEYTLAEMRSYLDEVYLPWINWPLQECGMI